jgi:hypothetical protein
VDVVASFPADAKASEAVEPGDRALDDVADDAQAGAVRLASLREHGADPAGPERAAVFVVVVAAVGRQRVGASARSADPARDGRDLVEQGQKLGDVAHGFRRSATRSSLSFDRSFSSSSTCNGSQTPAPFQAARRPQQVIPEPEPSSWGRDQRTGKPTAT